MGRSFTTRRGPLPLPRATADDPTLTRFAGALPFVRFCETLGLPNRLIAAVPVGGRKRTHAIHRVLFTFVVSAVLGAERLAHLDWFDGDALLLKLLRLSSWPVRKVFSTALACITESGVGALTDVLCDFALRAIHTVDSAVLDFDSTAVVTFGGQEGAAFGYCGRGGTAVGTTRWWPRSPVPAPPFTSSTGTEAGSTPTRRSRFSRRP